MENLKINVAIQLLPTKCSTDKIELIDKAIACIKASGLKHLVCPFETVVEGTYSEIFKLVNDKNYCLSINVISLKKKFFSIQWKQ